jgi:hypothetical protein
MDVGDRNTNCWSDIMGILGIIIYIHKGIFEDKSQLQDNMYPINLSPDIFLFCKEASPYLSI